MSAMNEYLPNSTAVVPFSLLTPAEKRRWWRWVRVNRPGMRDFLATHYRLWRAEFRASLHISRSDLLEALK